MRIMNAKTDPGKCACPFFTIKGIRKSMLKAVVTRIRAIFTSEWRRILARRDRAKNVRAIAARKIIAPVSIPIVSNANPIRTGIVIPMPLMPITCRATTTTVIAMGSISIQRAAFSDIPFFIKNSIIC
jgi:hypothetical protein